MLCDFRIASATALFGHPEIKAGVFKIQHGAAGWTCSYDHDPSRSSTVRFDSKGVLSAINSNPPPVP